MENYTQEQLDKILAEKLAEATKGLYSEDELNKRVTSEVDRRVETGIQKGLETQRQRWESEYAERAKLTAEELARKDFEDKIREVQEKERNIAKRANKLEAMDMLSQANIPKSQYNKVISMLVSNDEATTKANVQNFIDMFSETKSEIETRVKSEFSNIPKPKTGTNNGALTKEDFNKMSYSEKLKLKSSNPDLYRDMMK